jgi:hypothetical protein
MSLRTIEAFQALLVSVAGYLWEPHGTQHLYIAAHIAYILHLHQLDTKFSAPRSLRLLLRYKEKTVATPSWEQQQQPAKTKARERRRVIDTSSLSLSLSNSRNPKKNPSPVFNLVCVQTAKRYNTMALLYYTEGVE